MFDLRLAINTSPISSGGIGGGVAISQTIDFLTLGMLGKNSAGNFLKFLIFSPENRF